MICSANDSVSVDACVSEIDGLSAKLFIAVNVLELSTVFLKLSA